MSDFLLTTEIILVFSILFPYFLQHSFNIGMKERAGLALFLSLALISLFSSEMVYFCTNRRIGGMVICLILK